MKFKFPYKDANIKRKYGVDIAFYGERLPNANIVYEEVCEGHFEEFLDLKSTRIWFIVEGAGTFVINDEKIKVATKDLVVVPPNHRIHYFGKMKMILFTTPAFDSVNEKHIRDIKKEEKPYFKK